MKRITDKIVRRKRRKAGIRKGVFGTPTRPRLTVFRSNLHIYAQVIDDLTGKTLVAASSVEKDQRKSPGGNCDGAKAVGTLLAERAKGAGITDVVFDRNGFRYHGRVKALSESAREGGLKF
jgi:large subunit ribosomal protein L18